MSSAPPEPLDLFTVAPPGLEPLLAAELRGLGVDAEALEGGVAWRGGIEEVRRVNLHSRLASRVLVRLGSFRARSFPELERRAGQLPWSGYLGEGSVELRVSATKSRLSHRRAIAERLYRAMDVQPASGGPKDVETEGQGGQLFVVRVFRDVFTVSADSSGELLHRRGYRLETAKAPLRETLAAALLRAGALRGDQAFLDPLCGSGTLPIEAALMARRIPPGLAAADRTPRAYAFERWPGHERAAWEGEVARARAEILPTAPAPIFGSDRDSGAIGAAHTNAQRAGVEGDIEWAVAALSRAPHPVGPGLLATNPPYGQRLSTGRDLRDLYAALGAYVRGELAGWRLALLSPDRRLEAQIGLDLETVTTTKTGGLPVRLLRGG